LGTRNRAARPSGSPGRVAGRSQSSADSSNSASSGHQHGRARFRARPVQGLQDLPDRGRSFGLTASIVRRVPSALRSCRSTARSKSTTCEHNERCVRSSFRGVHWDCRLDRLLRLARTPPAVGRITGATEGILPLLHWLRAAIGYRLAAEFGGLSDWSMSIASLSGRGSSDWPVTRPCGGRASDHRVEPSPYRVRRQLAQQRSHSRRHLLAPGSLKARLCVQGASCCPVPGRAKPAAPAPRQADRPDRQAHLHRLPNFGAEARNGVEHLEMLDASQAACSNQC